MPELEAPACEPSDELRRLAEVASDIGMLRVLHSLSRAETATATELAAVLRINRADVERGLRTLEDAGLVDRVPRPPLPAIWAARIEQVQRAGLLWISFAAGNPDRAASVARDEPCCGRAHPATSP